MALRRSIHIILNPVAGARRSYLLHDLIARLEKAGAAVTLVETSGPGDATLLAKRAAMGNPDTLPDVIVAAGGDGTINEVARGLTGQSIPLGIVPLGTANVLAIELGLRPRAAEIATMLLAGPARIMGTGLVQGRLFLLMVGIGFDGRVIHTVNPSLKHRFGKGAVIWAGIKAWARGPGQSMRLIVDGREKQAQWVVVLNGRYFAGPYVLAQSGDITEPGLTLFLFRHGSRSAFARYLLALGLGRVERLSDVEVIAARHVEIIAADRASSHIEVEVDGDAAGVLPQVIEQGTKILRLVVPSSFGDKN
ncbi:MAG: diacylglycerol kinase family protein [Parvibaculum sp.]|nr:diacylglycerol kinase family protein [Parvibaculum sp.]